VQDLQPGEKRLVSYAIDLGTEVSPAPAQGNGRVTKLKAVKGVLTTTTKIVESRVYTAKNRSGQGRTLLVEHPVRHDFKLVDCKPAETAADVYRFEVKLPAGASKSLTVKEERLIDSSVAIGSQSDEQVRLLLRQTVASAEMKKGLQAAMELRWAVEKTKREAAELKRQYDSIVEDQKRLRANLKEMPATAKAYKRYLEKFDQQETQIERLQAEVKKLQAAQHSQQKALADFLAGFTTE
jgi:DNA repair exonuclease SbcCD ATPase subunit